MTVLTLLSLLLLGACNDADDKGPGDSSTPDDSTPTDDSSPTLDPATVPLAGTCAMDVDYGGFVIQASADESSITGAVADGVVPISVLEEIAAEGDCRLLRRNNPYCDPACDPGETCDFDGTCITYPSNQDLGTVTVTGLNQASTMEPVFPGNTSYDTSLTHPVMEGGELVTLQMPDGVYGPLELHGVGIEAVDMTGVIWSVADGQDLAITWPAPTASVVRSEVEIRISIDQHGITPSALYCTFADDGTGTVPASIITTLLSAGVTGFPTGLLERRTADKGAAGAGCMDLIVSAPRTVEVDVVGYTPCVADEDCPEGQDCNEELQICE